MEDYGAQLGPFFRHIRQRRGLKIRDVAAGVSETTLSRFERGQIDLTVAKLAPAIEAAEIDPDDIFMSSNQAKQAYDNAFDRETGAIVEMDSDEAAAALKAYKTATAHMQLPLRQYNIIALSYRAAAITEPFVRMTAEDEEQVVKFLTVDDDWHRFEYELFANLVYFMSKHGAERCLRLMQRSYKKRRHPVDERVAFTKAMVNAVRRPLADRDLDMAAEILKDMQQMEIGNCQPMLHAGVVSAQRLYDYLLDETPAHLHALEEYLQAVRTIGSDELADVTTHWLKAIGVPIKRAN
ncbi:helix-turn-helix transcriptional regulator [Lacticaseibacillus pabuli]|uniref:Helix-turn-helix transcriptional regulator n=1 Tax=Lacticaseibacillus pabuli TaxID=3025672 RepID=A0ABY7WRV4_9LACO|nr:helix-turn-helix transcriptional regulator [Lacticaseibacillus sp. KACC 23028]WDF82922.1 helix-turn-helix transcriptional regulator [Lacticaseibacillus sp. KACC 23028]